MNRVKLYKTEKFSLRKRLRSFGHAFAGIRSFFAAEHNAFIHLTGTIVVCGLSFWLGVTATEALVLLIVTAMVWAAELFNSAIEKMMDYMTRENQPSIKFIKDVSAAAVLVTAFAALLAGLLIFLPKIILL